MSEVQNESSEKIASFAFLKWMSQFSNHECVDSWETHHMHSHAKAEMHHLHSWSEWGSSEMHCSFLNSRYQCRNWIICISEVNEQVQKTQLLLISEVKMTVQRHIVCSFFEVNEWASSEMIHFWMSRFLHLLKWMGYDISFRNAIVHFLELWY